MAEPKYLKGYDDPDADLVIECSDKVKVRVHSYLLKAHSLYFRHMPDHSDAMSGKTEKLIHIDAKSCYFKLLLDVLIDQKSDGISNWETLQIVLKLGAQYKFLRVPESLRDRAGRVGAKLHRWTIFEFASQNDSPELARQVIPDMWDLYFRYDGKDIPRKDFERVSGPYASAFMVAMNAHPTSPIPLSGPGAQDTETGRWENIAKDFNPHRP